MAFVHEPRRRGRLRARALLDLALGRPLGNLDFELDQELEFHGFALMLVPAAETTHQDPPKWTKPWPLTSPAFLSWTK